MNLPTLKFPKLKQNQSSELLKNFTKEKPNFGGTAKATFERPTENSEK